MRPRFPAVFLLILIVSVASCGKDPEVAKREFLKSGDAFVAAGKLKEAAIEYRNAVQQDPLFGEARFKLAEVLVKNGDLVGAYGEYIRAADLMPTNPEALFKAGTMNLAAERFEDAKARAEQVLAIAPANADAQVLMANALAGMKEFDAAISIMEDAIAASPAPSGLYSNLAAMQMAHGKGDEAERSYLKGIEADPKSAVARNHLAGFYLLQRQYQRAETVLKEALSIAPLDTRANEMLASLYFSTNRAALAEAPLKVVADSTKSVASRVALADYYRVSGRAAEARQVLDVLEKDAEGFVAAKIRKAALAYSQGNRPEAYAEVDKAIGKEPRNTVALLVKADFLANDRKLAEALKIATTASEIEPTSASAHFALGRIRRALGQTEGAIASFNESLRLSPRSTAAQLELSRAHLSAGRPKDSLQFAQNVLSAQPQNADALLLQARGYLRLGDLQGAARPTDALVRAHPDAPAVHVQLGDLHRVKKDLAGARAAYTRALAIDSQNVAALTGLAGLDVQAGRSSEARARVDGALAKQPKSVPHLLLAAKVNAELGDFAGAERTLRHVITVEPNNLEVYELLGRIYRVQGKLDQAIAEFSLLAKKVEKPVGVHTAIGGLLEAQNKIAEAKKEYQKALSIDPNNPIAANNLAWLLAEHGGNLDEALQLAQTAKAGLPDSGPVSDTLGWIYYKKGLYGRAVSALKESVERHPDSAPFQYHLGFAYAKGGDVLLAQRSLETALKLDPSAADAVEARSVLAALMTLQ